MTQPLSNEQLAAQAVLTAAADRFRDLQWNGTVEEATRARDQLLRASERCRQLGVDSLSDPSKLAVLASFEARD